MTVQDQKTNPVNYRTLYNKTDTLQLYSTTKSKDQLLKSTHKHNRKQNKL